mgnify:CR=1 FL=1
MTNPDNATSGAFVPASPMEKALMLARAGVPVFPCAERDTSRLKAKSPLTKNGFKDRSTDEKVIRGWWKKWPDALAGVVPGDVGAVVIDLDIKKGVDGVAAFRELVADWREYPAMRTPSGGEHIWMAAPKCELGNARGALPKGIDVRCDHGYVCLGTLADGSAYEDLGGVLDTLLELDGEWPRMPRVVREALSRKQTATQAHAKPVVRIKGLIPPKELERVRSALEAIPEEDAADYQIWLEVGMGLCHWSAGGAEGFELWDAWSQKAGNYGDTESKWASFNGEGTTIGTVFWHAERHGWTPDHKKVKEQARREAKDVDGEPEEVFVNSGELSILATMCLDILAARNVEFFIRGDMLVRPVIEEMVDGAKRKTQVPALIQVTSPYMRDTLARHITFKKNKPIKSNGEIVDFEEVIIDPPKDLVEIVVNRRGEWPFPTVSGIISTPTLRPDGSVLAEPGYDADTCLYVAPSIELPVMPDRPTRKDAEAAADLLEGLLVEFPFVDDASYSVGLSALITPVVRGCMDVAPMHVTTAPAAGTGKSYLLDTASTICMGVCCPVLSAGKTEEEMGKRLGAKVMAGHPILCIDNVESDLGGDDLCQVVERKIVEVRVLGKSEMVRAVNRYCVFATGNNLRVRGDMTRRTLLAAMDAKCERPAERPFKSDPVAMAGERRGHYIAACLTLVRAYFEAGRPAQKLKPMGSFGMWSDSVRSALVWLGYADPCVTIEATRENDPELQQLTQFMRAWITEFGVDAEYSTGEIAEHVGLSLEKNKLMKEACEPFMRSGKINVRSLGRWIAKQRGRVITVVHVDERMSLAIKSRELDGVLRWFLT